MQGWRQGREKNSVHTGSGRGRAGERHAGDERSGSRVSGLRVASGEVKGLHVAEGAEASAVLCVRPGLRG